MEQTNDLPSKIRLPGQRTCLVLSYHAARNLTKAVKPGAMTVPWHLFIRWFGGGNFASSCQNVPFFEEIVDEKSIKTGLSLRVTVCHPNSDNSMVSGFETQWAPRNWNETSPFFSELAWYSVFDMISNFQI